jgi:hypothetical protein
MSGLLRLRFNASAQNQKIRPVDDETEQHNRDATFRQIVLIGFMIFSKFIYPR